MENILERNLPLEVKAQRWRTAKWLHYTVWSFWIVFIIELLSRGQWLTATEWGFGAIPALLVNAVAVLSLLLIVTAVIGSSYAAFWIVGTLCFALGLVSGVKLHILGVPFLPWDLNLTSETEDMAQYVSGVINATVVSAFIAFAAGSFLLVHKLPMKLIMGWKQRIVTGAVSVLLLYSVYSDGTVSLTRLAQIQNISWDQSENVETNGLLLSTLMNLGFLVPDKPEGYNEETIRTALAGIKPAVDKAGGVKPNIIVVLSESFWDATQVKGLTFSRDPLPFYHELMKKYSSGTLLSPQFGGGTANVEFEVLTGNSMRFMPQGSIPYNQFIKKDVDSLGSILSRQGYASTAISPFYSWFFNSKNIYRHFGFSNYISEEFMTPDYEGPYIADREVAKQIIEASQRSSGPDFIFADTMQNHYHYYPGKFKENTIEVSGVTGESKGLLETYAQGLIGVDDMLKRLVSHYEKLDEPTILLFFGDHLPSLGDNYGAFKDSGFLKENDPDELNKMYRTPILVWNNYLPEHKENLNMSPSFVGPYLLKLANLPGNYYMDYLYQLYQKTPVIPPSNYYEEMGIRKQDLAVYESMQYDIIFGEQYGYGEMKSTIKNKDFILGPGPLTIHDVKLDGGMLKITGANLPYTSLIRINGEQVQTNWISSNEIMAQMDTAKQKPFPWKVDVIVKDSKNILLSASNEVPYSLK
jgi:phosphoglycerol transferase MdoB-like AlkP superfamily enzyme